MPHDLANPRPLSWILLKHAFYHVPDVFAVLVGEALWLAMPNILEQVLQFPIGWLKWRIQGAKVVG